MAEKTREEKFVQSSTAQRERLEWDENRKIVQNVFSMDSMDWENLYSLQRHRKIPVGSLIQHDDPFFLNRKQEERNPHRKTHVFITREHHIHRYCVCVVCVYSSPAQLQRRSIELILRGSLLFFRVPYQPSTKGRMFVSKSKETYPFYAVGIFFSSSSSPFLTLIPGSMAQHSVILQTKPQFSCDETQPKTHSDLWYHQWRDEKQVQPQFPSLHFSL